MDSERRKLEKFEKKKKINSEEKKYVGDGGADSTDAEDLEIKVIKLLQCLEKVVEHNERSIAKKRRFSKIVSFGIFRKVLKTKFQKKSEKNLKNFSKKNCQQIFKAKLF